MRRVGAAWAPASRSLARESCSSLQQQQQQLRGGILSSLSQSYNNQDHSALNMATNSRELRFFADVEVVQPQQQQHHEQQQQQQSNNNKRNNAADLTLPGTLSEAGWLFQKAMNPQSFLAEALFGSWNHHLLGGGGSSSSTATTTTTKVYASSSISMTTISSSSSSSTTSFVGRRTMTTTSGSMATTNTLFRSFSSITASSSSSSGSDNNNNNNNAARFLESNPDHHKTKPVYEGYGSSIQLTDEERQLFALLRRVRKDTGLDTTLRVAGGWVRDKLLATPEFSAYHAVFGVGGRRLTSKFRSSTHNNNNNNKNNPPTNGALGSQLGVNHLSANEAYQKPVDIDIALDDMLGREFAEHLNDYLQAQGEETHSVGVVVKNPEKSKHLETATMKVGSFWIDFVNLRAEEYTTQDSRIPDLMRIGNACEDAFRRDLTINSLFYNINTGQVEDWTGRGFADLRKGMVATPLPPLTTLLDDPLRVLRSIRFAARLRFNMNDELVAAAKDVRVHMALAHKVSRERVGSEVDLMLRSPDPVGAMRLLLELKLYDTVFPDMAQSMARQGLALLSTAHDHLADCKWSRPMWCSHNKMASSNNPSADTGLHLLEDEEARRLLWYSSFLKPLYDFYTQQEVDAPPEQQFKKQKRQASPVQQILVDALKRPTRDAEAISRIMKSADDITELVQEGSVVSATMVLLSDINIRQDLDDGSGNNLVPYMNGRHIDSMTEEDPVWIHAMEFRLTCFKLLARIGPLWRAALILSLSEELDTLQDEELDYAIEGDVVEESRQELRRGIIERYDIFAAALIRLGLIGTSWNSRPLLDGGAVKEILPHIPKGPTFREIMDEQTDWISTHPGGSVEGLTLHLQAVFSDYGPKEDDAEQGSKKKGKKKQE